MGLFDGKVAIVTGAGRGIGRSEALLLAGEGARVVVNDLGGSGAGEGADQTPAQAVVDEIKAAGGDGVANYDDCASWTGAEAMVQQAIDTFGGLDVLICNAGILRDKMSFNMTEEEFDSVIRVHLKGHFAPIRFAGAYWRAKAKETREPTNAAVVTTSSESGLYGNAGQVNYAAAKAGIASMTIVLARELGRSGVRVNSIAPVAATRLLGTVIPPEVNENPMMSPDNPAAGAVWLASPLAGGVTGQVLKIMGGVAQILDGWRPATQISSSEKWTLQALADGRDLLFKDRDPGVPPFRAMDTFEDTVSM
jgi:NAD(P)-dependent dehydrogenase (short-subunit alcohol dehydrogenase family)